MPRLLAITSGEPAGIGPDLCLQLAQHEIGQPLVVLADKLWALPGVKRAFASSFFHDAVRKLNDPATDVLSALRPQGILGRRED